MGVIQNSINQLINQTALLGTFAAHSIKQGPWYKGKQALQSSKNLTQQSEALRQASESGEAIGSPIEQAQKRLAANKDAAEVAQEAAKQASEAVGYLGIDKKTSTAYSKASQARGKAQTGIDIQQRVLDRTRSEMENPIDTTQSAPEASSAPDVTSEQAMNGTTQKMVKQIRQRTNFAELLEGTKHPYNGEEVLFENLPKGVQKGVVQSLTPADKKELKQIEAIRQGAQGETVSFGGEEIGTVGQLPKRYQQQIARNLKGGK